MSIDIQAVKGMKDILPDEIWIWQHIENTLTNLFGAYGYQEIRMPLLEPTELFKRSIGEVTDIVEKEMYTFQDKGGDSLTLRPEGTAQCVRAVIQSGMIRNSDTRLWYQGPMFRRENPQKGRYRQFYQFGVEAFGLTGPEVDVEHILLMARCWKSLNIEQDVKLELNSIGTPSERNIYKQELVDYFQQNITALDADSKRRLESNPLRILDSKNPEMQEVINEAPVLLNYLTEQSLQHFEYLKQLLDINKINYNVNPRLVRGLDYYTHTVYEWVTDRLGAQGTICAGGRFDNLVEQIGGKPTPAVGFAVGLERVILLVLECSKPEQAANIDAYLISSGDKAQQHSLKIAEQLRNGLPGFRILTNCNNGSFKSQFKKADKSGANIAIVIGDEEVEKGLLTIKYLREEKPQQSLKIDEAIELLKK